LMDAAVNAHLGFASRTGPDQRALLLDLAASQGDADRVESLLPSQAEQSRGEERDPIGELSEMSLAIYSLTESAARMAGGILERQYNGVKIHYNGEEDCSRRLQQLARNADLFVMVTASSKHAATGCIEMYRPKELPLLRPSGKGVASILRAVRQHFRSVS
jgi:hypothetical protein